MGKSIGLLELRSTPMGMLAADEMLKAANVELLLATPICPGKYVVVACGQVGAVESAMKAGVHAAGSFLVGHHVIHNVHDATPAALTGTTEIESVKAIGVVETISALAAIRAGDAAVKAANVQLIEIRIARGLGGKGFFVCTGEVSAIQQSIAACEAELADCGEITSSCVIPSPARGLIEKLL